ASNMSQPTKRKIEAKDKKAPDAPSVNKVTDQDTNITGIGEKETTVKVVVDGQEIGTGKVDEKGNFKVDIPKQPVGKEIVLTLTDVAGNTSKPIKVVVQNNHHYQNVLVKEAKQAINGLFTDLIQTNYSHDFSNLTKVAIQLDVTQLKIDEAESKLEKIDDQRAEKIALKKEIDRARQLLNERENEQDGNMLQNGLFNFGFDNWKLWTGSEAIAPSIEEKDDKSVKVAKVNPNSSVEQTITGLEPSTTYELTLYAKTDNYEKFSIGVKNTGTPTVSVPVKSKEYSQTKLRFITGENATTATLYFYKSGGNGSGYADMAILKQVIDEKAIQQAIHHLFADRIYSGGNGEEKPTKQAIQPNVKKQDIDRIENNVNLITDPKVKKQLKNEVKRAQDLYEEKQRQQTNNQLKNGSFEEKLKNWKSWKSSAANIAPIVLEKEGRLSNVLKFEIGASSVEQTLQVEPNTIYELAGYGKTENGEKLSLGVKKMIGVSDIGVANSSNDYVEQVLRFKTGPNTTSATVYVYKGVGTKPSYIDDIRLYKVNSITNKQCHSIEPLDFKSVCKSEATDWGNKLFSLWDNLTPQIEKDAVRGYTGIDYEDINSYLRSDYFDVRDQEKIKRSIQQMDLAFSRVRLYEDMIVYRRASESAFGYQEGTLVNEGVIDMEQFEMFKNRFQGKYKKDPTYISTSIVKDVAEGFSNRPILLKIHVPKGVPAMYLDPLTHFSGEMELLLPRNRTYKVKTISPVTEEDREYVMLDVEILDIPSNYQNKRATDIRYEGSLPSLSK
ncbi:ADP-ribosyltransferase, partial [Bacillus toyonensis]|uniref:ADP-ribosyltransferase n=1 Tax=Bacillus toyonensis TaxID=155322 RepID=UPI003D2079D4